MTVPTKNHCPLCGYYADDWMGVSNDPNAVKHVPRVGDVALCINCAGVSIWTAFGRRRPNDSELDELLKDELIIKAISAIMEVKK